jgi:hypothetical protein
MVNIARSYRFRKDLLPVPRIFYERQFGPFRHRKTRRGWVEVLCLFHPDHNPSLSINVESGAFKCWSCDAHGGDVIDFVRLRDNVDFKTAAKTLGAWDDGLQIDAVVVRGPDSLAPHLVLDFDIDGAHYSAAVEDEPWNYADMVLRFYREASDRLIELSRGDAESYIGEQQDCWAGMACAQDELREMGSV